MKKVHLKAARRAFTLLELLVVVAIIGILATLSMTAISALVSSSNLNQAGAIVQSQLDLARQTAITLNRSVQLRFYVDNNNTTAKPSIDCLQVVVPSQSSPSSSTDPETWVEKIVYLPQNMIIADDANADWLIPQTTVASIYPTLPTNIPLTYYALTFSTTGVVLPAPTTEASTSTPTNDWVIYIVPQNTYRAQGAPATKQKNYYAFNLNYRTGTYTATRP